MGQSDSLRNRKNQHKPKNEKSKLDDKNIYVAMNEVTSYLYSRFDIKNQFPDLEISFEKSIDISYMIDFIKRKKLERI